MFRDRFMIGNIPTVLWGEMSKKLFIAVFDLPEHGERKGESIPCKAQFCVGDLSIIMNYAKEHWKEVSLFACSMGAYFTLAF